MVRGRCRASSRCPTANCKTCRRGRRLAPGAGVRVPGGPPRGRTPGRVAGGPLRSHSGEPGAGRECGRHPVLPPVRGGVASTDDPAVGARRDGRESRLHRRSRPGGGPSLAVMGSVRVRWTADHRTAADLGGSPWHLPGGVAGGAGGHPGELHRDVERGCRGLHHSASQTSVPVICIGRDSRRSRRQCAHRTTRLPSRNRESPGRPSLAAGGRRLHRVDRGAPLLPRPYSGAKTVGYIRPPSRSRPDSPNTTPPSHDLGCRVDIGPLLPDGVPIRRDRDPVLRHRGGDGELSGTLLCVGDRSHVSCVAAGSQPLVRRARSGVDTPDPACGLYGRLRHLAGIVRAGDRRPGARLTVDRGQRDWLDRLERSVQRRPRSATRRGHGFHVRGTHAGGNDGGRRAARRRVGAVGRPD